MEKAIEKGPVPFRGMMPILATPVTPDGEIDEASQRRLVQYSLQCGAVAVGHLGYASEFQKLSESQRAQVIEITVDEVAGRVPVFIGVTGPSERVTVQYAKDAAARRADMLMLGLPYISMPDAHGAFAIYRRVGEETGLPIIVQDTPAASAVLSVELMRRMFEEIEQVQYVKAEGTNFVGKSHALLEQTGGRLPVIGGAGGRHMIHLLRVGVTSFMTGTEALDLHNAVVQAYLAGDEEKAASLYFNTVLPYLTFYTEASSVLLKEMLHARGIIDHKDTIAPPPKESVGEIERRELAWVLERIGWKKSWPNIP